MTHQDHGRRYSACLHVDDLQQAVRWLLVGVSFAGIALRSDCTWTPQSLLVMAWFWAWSGEKTLGERFLAARKIIMDCFGGQQEPAGSYQAFIKLLGRWTEPLRAALSTAFRQRMPDVLARVLGR